MAELQVLHGEARHKVEGFVNEMLWRREDTIREMRPALTSLIATICDQLGKMKEEEPRLPLHLMRFAQSRWTPTGKLLFEFEIAQEGAIETDRYFVDDLVNDIVGRNRFIAPMRDEIAQSVSALVDAFGHQKNQHPQLDLKRVTFVNAEWIANLLVIEVKYDGKPMGYREGRL